MRTMNELMTGSNTIRARGYVFTKEQMASYRIKGVYNSTADVDYMDENYMIEFTGRCYDPTAGECAIRESAIRIIDGKAIRVLSVIVFYDLPSLELYMLANQGLYLPLDRNMGGRLN